MGFRTLAIQKRSGEVWTVLAAVKTEFEKFGAGLQAMQRHLNQTGSDLEELIGTRSRAITRKLEQVAAAGTRRGRRPAGPGRKCHAGRRRKCSRLPHGCRDHRRHPAAAPASRGLTEALFFQKMTAPEQNPGIFCALLCKNRQNNTGNLYRFVLY